MQRSWFLLLSALIVSASACAEEVGPGDSGRRDTGRNDTGSMDTGSTDLDSEVPLDNGSTETPDVEVPDFGTPDVPIIPTDTPFIQPDAGRCMEGTLRCVARDRRSICQADGSWIESDCALGQVCVDGQGCQTCEPGSVRCNADGVTIEQCNAAGAGWTMMSRCDPAMGMVCSGYRCVNACERAKAQRSYLGCEYWPTPLANPALGAGFDFAVTVANPQTYAVSVTVSGGGMGSPITFSVPSQGVTTRTLPWIPTVSSASSSVLASNAAYVLTSTAPVAVYQFNPLQFQSPGGGFSYTNDASLLLPTHVLTGNYRVLTRQTWQSFGGLVGIVGTSATPTTVTVNLRSGVRAGTGVAAVGAGGTITQTLARGQVLQLLSAGSAGTDACTADDLTGSVITASQPVAVFVGHACTNMPCGSDACDHLEEQLFPSETWGKRYVVSALRERSSTEPSVIRLLASTQPVTLTFQGIAAPSTCPATLAVGQFCEFQTTPDFMVSGSAPFLAAQFMVGEAVVAGSSGGDPAMVLEVPVEQFRTSYTFNVPGSYTQNFITIVHATGSPPRLDGAATPIAAGTSIPGTTYSVARFAIAAGNHNLLGTTPFGIKVSGVGSFTSYMYPGGLDLNQL